MIGRTGVEKSGWWRRNRLALMALVPLAAAAALASSYQYRTFYLPNDFSNMTRAPGRTLDYREQFTSNRKTHARAVKISLVSLEPRPLAANAEAAAGTSAMLWEAELRFTSRPDVPLGDCTLAMIDDAGQVYRESGRDLMPKLEGAPAECVPSEAPGPVFDFLGDLETPAAMVRPPSWPVRGQFVLPARRKPAFIRVAWKKPNAALIPVK